MAEISLKWLPEPLRWLLKPDHTFSPHIQNTVGATFFPGLPSGSSILILRSGLIPVPDVAMILTTIAKT
jgi:hypothetical protein